MVWLGEFVSAREHLEQGMRLYTPRQDRSLAFLYGYDPGVACLSLVALTLWHLGYPEQALRRNDEALTLARQLSHPFSLTYALAWTAVIHALRREEHVTQEWAQTGVALSTEHGFMFHLAYGTILLGWALAGQG